MSKSIRGRDNTGKGKEEQYCTRECCQHDRLCYGLSIDSDMHGAGWTGVADD